MSNVFKGLAEAANDQVGSCYVLYYISKPPLSSRLINIVCDMYILQNLAICASTVIYLMSRDFISLPVDAHSLRLLSQLLRIEKLDQNEEQKKYASLVCLR